MDVIIRIVLTFLLIQTLVVIAIMIVALLVARPEVPLLGRELRSQVLTRSLHFLTRLLSRGFRLAARLARFVRTKLFLPVYPF